MGLAEWWAALSGTQQIFWTISIISTVLFVIQFVLSMIGLDSDTDIDFDVDHGFHIISVRGVISFLMLFGWTGVLVIGNGGSLGKALLLGSIAGGIVMVVIAYLFYFLLKMQDDGSKTNVYEALNQVATVYLVIPEKGNGTGKVQLLLNGSLQELDAITEDGEPIPTGAEVRILDVIDDKILLVESETKFLPK